MGLDIIGFLKNRWSIRGYTPRKLVKEVVYLKGWEGKR